MQPLCGKSIALFAANQPALLRSGTGGRRIWRGCPSLPHLCASMPHLRRKNPPSCRFQRLRLGARRPGKTGPPRDLNFNVFNLRKQSAGCFRETTKDLRKTIRHLEKTTKHLEKIIRQVVAPSSGLFFGKSGQKETEEALYLQEVLGIAMQIYNIFQRKANRQNCILTFREQRRPRGNLDSGEEG